MQHTAESASHSFSRTSGDVPFPPSSEASSDQESLLGGQGSMSSASHDDEAEREQGEEGQDEGAEITVTSTSTTESSPQTAGVRRNCCNRPYLAPLPVRSVDKPASQPLWCQAFADHVGCTFCGFIYDSKGWASQSWLCGHSVCLSCVELTYSLYSSAGVERVDALCPACCAPVTMELAAAKAATNSSAVTKNQSDCALLGTDDSMEGAMVCENCEIATATLWCEFCRINFCPQCDTEIHASNAMRKHLRCAVAQNAATHSESSRDIIFSLPQQDSPSTPRNSSCPAGSPEKSKKTPKLILHSSRLPAVCNTHRLHILDKFCERCLCVVCAECTATATDAHAGHPVRSLEAAADELRDKLSETIEEARMQLSSIRSVLLKLNGCIAALRVPETPAPRDMSPVSQAPGVESFPNAYCEAVRVVEKEFESFRTAMQARKSELVNDVVSICDERVELLLEERKRLKTISDKATAAVNSSLGHALYSVENVDMVMCSLRSAVNESVACTDIGILDDDIPVAFSGFPVEVLRSIGGIVVEKEVLDFEAYGGCASPDDSEQKDNNRSMPVYCTSPGKAKEHAGSSLSELEGESLRLKRIEARNLILQAKHLQCEANAAYSHLDRILTSLTGRPAGVMASLPLPADKGKNRPLNIIGTSSASHSTGANSSLSADFEPPVCTSAVERATRDIDKHFDELLAAASYCQGNLMTKLRSYVNVKREYYLSCRARVLSMQSSMLFYALQILHAYHSDDYLIATNFLAASGNQLTEDFQESFQSQFYVPLGEKIFSAVPVSFAFPVNDLLCDHGSVGAPPGPVNVGAKLNHRGRGHNVVVTWSCSSRNDRQWTAVKFFVQMAVGRALTTTDALTIDTYDVPFADIVDCDGDTMETVVDVQNYPGRIIQFRVRVLCCESRNSSVWSEPCSLRTPDTFRRVFEYKAPFDQGGLLYWLGTNGGTAVYRNPHLSGAVTVTMSTCSTSPHMFVDHVPDRSYCMTTDRVQQWICVDIGPNRLLHPTGYCLRTAKGDTWKLRNWDLQARADRKGKWVVIRRHKNCKSLTTTSYSAAAWRIEIPSVDVAGASSPGVSNRSSGAGLSCQSGTAVSVSENVSQALTLTGGDVHAYRYFRIFQTGVNSSSDNYLVCNGIELYGVLYTGD